MTNTLRTTTWMAIAALGTALLPGGAHAQAAQWTVGSVPAYFTGKYGTANTIDIFYLPTYIQYRKDRLRIKLTVPYESVTGLPQGATLAGSNLSTRGTQTQTRSASGMGDTWLTVRYAATHARDGHIGVHPYAKIKIATASHSAGLGSGHNDYEFGVGLDGRAGGYTFPFAHVGYRLVGKPANSNLQNIMTYDFGASYVLPRSQANILTAMFSGSQSEQKGYAGPADVIVAWNHNVTRAGSGFQLYVDKGLSNGSARYGIGFGGQIVF
ncbi:hypothetical protein [Acidihalobacter prosperus]|uniref:Transporter n=1 Tax=Acidihalobacter prosperus TaxID=160660 RepID=A0A1A6C1Z4_9GAMM|nr:hypothetical protein [Acidihalobacter prosperus]OBS08569.1 hypothetical protein Thpro_022819 [Acidihalobacter prosperus]